MKKNIATVLVLVMCITYLVGCQTKSDLSKKNGPPEEQVIEDVISHCFGDDWKEEDGKWHRNIKVEITLADQEGDEYFASGTVNYDYKNTSTYVWENTEWPFEIKYKHYDTGGWKYYRCEWGPLELR